MNEWKCVRRRKVRRGWSCLKLRERVADPERIDTTKGFVTKGFGGWKGVGRDTKSKTENRLKLSCVVQRRCEQRLKGG